MRPSLPFQTFLYSTSKKNPPQIQNFKLPLSLFSKCSSMSKSTSSTIIVLLVAILAILLYNNCNHKTQPVSNNDHAVKNKTAAAKSINELTKEATVVAYVKQNGQLPAYYITKKAAREQGWNAADGNLCAVLPGKAIGGDVFTNREGNLPQKAGRTWYEADLNYNCGRRNADRLLFSSDGLVFVTKDHYKTFQEK